MRTVSADSICTAPNADIANRIAAAIQGDVASPLFIQRTGRAWAVMSGGDNIISEGSYGDACSQMAALLDRGDD